MKKRILSLLLALVLVVGLLPVSALAVEEMPEVSAVSAPPLLEETTTAAEEDSPAQAAAADTGSNYIDNIIFTISGGTDTSSIGADIRWDSTLGGYCVVLPDTRATTHHGIIAYGKDNIPSDIQYAMYDPAKKGYMNKSTGFGGKFNLMAVLMPTKLPVGKTTDLEIRVGKNWLPAPTGSLGLGFETVLESIPLHVYTKVGLSGLTVSAGENDTKLTPAFNSIIPAYAVAVAEGQETITLSPNTKTALATESKAGTVLHYTDAAGTPIQAADDTGKTFAISSLPVNADGNHYICITVSYSDESKEVGSTTYTVVLTEPKPPVVEAVGETKLEFEKDSNTPIEVRVTNIDAAENASFTYQWYNGLPSDAESYKGFPITGATGAAYQADTAYAARESAYWCDVTKHVDGVAITVHSPVFLVTVAASYASPPVITKQPVDVTVQENLYAVFELSAEGKDSGAHLSAKLYRVDPDGEDILVTEYTNPEAGYNKSELTLLRFRLDTSVSGAYQYYCVITSTVNGHSADARTATVTLTVEGIAGVEKLTGTGTERDPYQIASLDDLNTLKSIVENGYSLAGKYIKLTNDLTLPLEWDPIGNLKEGHPELDDLNDGTGKGVFVNPFSGTFDGAGHKLTIAEGGQGLFRYVRQATIRNLKVYGKDINGSALITACIIDYGPTGNYNSGHPMWTAKIDHVTLLSGSHTTSAGFLPATGSGANDVTITNSTVEEGVVIGSPEAPGGASFVSSLNGKLINCVSYATVYGTGGLAGSKGQTMGACEFENCAFLGTLISKGYAGGIIGSGYDFEAYFTGTTSAPNTPLVRINNCYVNADITGQYMVGGIFGGEPCVKRAWGNGIGQISNNVFVGTLHDLSGTSDVGGIVGYLNSFDKYQGMNDNYYKEDCGAAQGIGRVKHVVTVEEDSENGVAAEPDWTKMTEAVTHKRLTDGSLVEALNKAPRSYGNWLQGKDSPVLSDEPVVYKLETSGKYKDTYYIGDALDLTGLTLTASWSDGRTETVALDDPELKITGYAPNTRGVQTVTLAYGAAKAEIEVTVLKRPTTGNDKISVSFIAYGDVIHSEKDEATGNGLPTSDGGPHTLRNGKLVVWSAQQSYEVDQNATVWDVIQLAMGADYDFDTNEGLGTTYIAGVKPKSGGEATWLKEFTNGPGSGWMYTLNGEHPNLGVAQQYLDSGDVIVFHYTDDYTQERGSEHWSAPETTTEKPKVTVTTGADGKPVAKVELPKGAASAVATIPTAELGSGNVLVLVKPDGSEEIIKKSLVEGETAYALVTENCTVKLVDNSKSFNDTANHWAKDAIAFASSHALFEGTAANTFSPDMSMSRAMLAAVLYRLEDAAASGTNPFADVAAGTWYTDAVTWANANQIVYGTDSGFEPDRDISRQELVAMLYRYAKFAGMDTTKTANLTSFTDNGEVADWAKESMRWAVANGLVSGRTTTTLVPTGTATRAEVAAILQRLVGLMVK